MTLKSHAKCSKNPTGSFKSDIKNLVNSTQAVKKQI